MGVRASAGKNLSLGVVLMEEMEGMVEACSLWETPL